MRGLDQPLAPRSIDLDQLVYVNGELVPARYATVSVFDSGFNFADGVFEGVRVYNGRVFKLHEHIRRLFASARSFDIEIPMSESRFGAEILRWLRTAGIRDGFHFRPIVTRGNRYPPRLDPRFASGTTIVFVGGPISAVDRGIHAIVSNIRRTSPEALDPHIKSLNYGNNLLARLDAIRKGADDAIMLDAGGYLSEATGANLFLVSDGELLTPLGRACLEGITRQTIIELATAEGLSVTQCDLAAVQLQAADEIFTSGTGAELTSVIEIDGKPVGSGGPGALTTRLRGLYRELANSTGVPIGSLDEIHVGL